MASFVNSCTESGFQITLHFAKDVSSPTQIHVSAQKCEWWLTIVQSSSIFSWIVMTLSFQCTQFITTMLFYSSHILSVVCNAACPHDGRLQACLCGSFRGRVLFTWSTLSPLLCVSLSICISPPLCLSRTELERSNWSKTAEINNKAWNVNTA